jgi:hypothetical protein
MQPVPALQVNLASQLLATETPSASVVPIAVSIHNPAESPVTVLKWNSPLDTRAGVLGVFVACDTGNGVPLPLDIIKISRKLPPSLDDLVEISAGQTLQITVDLPGLHFQKGHEYSVHATGTWHAVWDKALADVTVSQLSDLGRANRGGYRSNVAFIKVD